MFKDNTRTYEIYMNNFYIFIQTSKIYLLLFVIHFEKMKTFKKI